MKLVAARITNYKSVTDSGEFSLDRECSLVGKNESGKTAILEALYKLNPVGRALDGLFEGTDYPRRSWPGDDSIGDQVAVRTRWRFDDEERQQLASLTNREVPETAEAAVWKSYDNQLHIDVLLDGPVPDVPATGENGDAAAAKPAPDAVAEYVESRLPTFVLFRDYDRLPGLVAVEDLQRRQASGDVSFEDRVFLALLRLAGVSLSDLADIGKSERFIAKLEAVGNRISEEIFEYWSQNRHLEVQFRYDPARPEDAAPYNSGHVFQTRIRNARHGVSVNFDQRSTGFIWFFSFLVWFSQVRENYGDNIILLLDEPGLSLHATAQKDLVRYFRERLVPTYQVVYSTHSPFMIDSSGLLAAHTVEDVTRDGQVLGTKVGDESISADSETLLPLRAALGYDITASLSLGAHSLLVERPSDLLYLQWASDALSRGDGRPLSPAWTVTPCGGIAKIGALLALLGGQRLDLAVFLNSSDGIDHEMHRLRESELLGSGRVLSAEQYSGTKTADMEDLLGRSNYIALLNAAYGLGNGNALSVKVPAQSASAAASAPVADRVLVEAEAHMRTLQPDIAAFDHFTPAAFLIANSDDLEWVMPDPVGALERFQRLVDDLNSFL